MAAAPIPWSSANTPIDWDVIGINWDTAAKTESPSYGVLADQATTVESALSPSISFGVLADQSNTGILSIETAGTFGALGETSGSGGMLFSGSVSMGALVDQAMVMGLTFAETTSLGVLSDYVNNVTYPESVTMAAIGDWSSADAFLWNEKSDVTTTWTKVP